MTISISLVTIHFYYLKITIHYSSIKLVGTGSNTSSSRIDEQLKQIQEITQKYENKLSVSIEDWEQYIKIWEMPKQNIKELYKIGSFEIKRDFRIKISENTHSIGSET